MTEQNAEIELKVMESQSEFSQDNYSVNDKPVTPEVMKSNAYFFLYSATQTATVLLKYGKEGNYLYCLYKDEDGVYHENKINLLIKHNDEISRFTINISKNRLWLENNEKEKWYFPEGILEQINNDKELGIQTVAIADPVLRSIQNDLLKINSSGDNKESQADNSFILFPPKNLKQQNAKQNHIVTDRRCCVLV